MLWVGSFFAGCAAGAALWPACGSGFCAVAFLPDQSAALNIAKRAKNVRLSVIVKILFNPLNEINLHEFHSEAVS